MIYDLIDPHPGRCLNFRRDPGDPYGVKTLRCLRLEGHSEKCRFPPASIPLGSRDCSYSTTNYTPEPWVEPPMPE